MGNTEILDSVLHSAGEKLFSRYGLHVHGGVRPPEVDGLSMPVVAVMSFTSAGLRGSLMLALSAGALEASLPVWNARPADWLGELANQFVGGIKQQLLTFGADIALSTPLAFPGERMSRCMKGDQTPMVWSFEEGAGYTWLDCEIAEGFELLLDAQAPVSAEEGDVVLF